MKKIRIILNLTDSRLLFNLDGIEAMLSKYGKASAYPANNLKNKELRAVVVEIDPNHEYVKEEFAFEHPGIRTVYLNEMSGISMAFSKYTFQKLIKDGGVYLSINSFSASRVAEIKNDTWKHPVGLGFDLESITKDLQFDFFSYEADGIVKVVTFGHVNSFEEWEKEAKNFAKSTSSKIEIINTFKYNF